MAHVKVVRRSMGKEEWIKFRAEWLSRRVVKKSFEIEGWQIREGRQIDEMEYEFYDEDYRPINKGDMMFTPDGTAFLKVSTKMPAELQKEEVWIELATSAEMIIKVNGKWAGGIDPNRHRMLISPYVGPDGKADIEIEGYNRSKPDDERNPQSLALRGCRQVFSGVRFLVVDHEIEAAMYDVNILVETMESEYVNEDVRQLIKNELDKALNLVDYEETDEEVYLQSVRLLRKSLKENVFDNKTFNGNGKVALVAHSHLDLAYYWKRMHTIQKNARTCLIQLRLMDKYPEYKYSHTQAYTYETLEKYYPEIFEELRERVKEGRFEIVGAMYVEPDCNIPTAEALVRQCLYGQHYFRSRFGITVDNCWLPDVFGNSWILPQILKKSGVNYFVSNKMSTWNDTNKFPHNNFIWKGIDGTEVYACVPPTHFITWNTPEQIIENWETFQDKDACDETLNMYGYGDGGSGATEQMIEYARRLNDVPGLPETRVIRGDEFLKENLENNAELSVWDGELYLEMHRGTFTTKGILKKKNRKLELLLRDTELLCTLASLQGFEYPHEKITECWKKLLINQFHDILPGTHIPPVTLYALKDYDEIEKQLNEIIEAATNYLNLSKSSASENKKYNVVNTLAWKVNGPVFIKGEFEEGSGIKEAVSQVGTSRGEKGIWFESDTLAPVSVKTFDVERTLQKSEKWFTFENNTLDTPFYKAVFETDGSISSLIYKELDREIVKKGKKINKLKIYRDNPGMYDAWDILPNYKDREEKLETISSLSIESFGDVFVSFLVKYKTKESAWTQRIRFFKNSERIEFENDVDWNETNRMAKVEFDLDLLSRYIKCDTSAGAITRETHKNTTWQKSRFEVCHHKWADMSEADFGVALLNDGKYGMSAEENIMALTLLRSPIRPDINCDKGFHSFTYALLPHKGSPEAAGINEAAWKFNTELKAFKTSEETSVNWIKLEGSNLHLQAVKMPEECENKNTFIVRIVELNGTRGTGIFEVFKPIKEAVKINLLEDIVEEKDFSIENGILKFKYKPNEIISFKVTL